MRLLVVGWRVLFVVSVCEPLQLATSRACRLCLMGFQDHYGMCLWCIYPENNEFCPFYKAWQQSNCLVWSI